MAIAGKVAITLSTENGGAWSADVTYDRLVAVKHNNNLYISRKTVANVEPPNNDFWFLALEGFGGDDVQALIDRLNELSDLIQAIINGTTQVGNAKTLDGHEAEDFAQKTDLVNYVPLDGSKPMTGEFLKIMSGYGALSASQGHVALVSYPNPNDTNVSDVLVMFNSLWGNRGIFYRQQVNDVLTDYAILHTGNMASHVLPLSGGKIGYLYIQGESKNGYSHILKNASAIVDNGTDFIDASADNKKACLNVSALANAAYFVGNDNIAQTLLHTGNKPVVQYTGTGESRTVNIGGVANAVVVAFGDTMALVSMGGAIVKSGSTITALNKEEVQFDPNTKNLILNTARVELNTSGYLYTCFSI